MAQNAIEEVRVTGVPINQSPDDLAQSVTVISGAQLDRVRSANLGETLAGELGVSVPFGDGGNPSPLGEVRINVSWCDITGWARTRKPI
jgi:outer membrane receptor protein involved in Fe transport